MAQWRMSIRAPCSGAPGQNWRPASRMSSRPEMAKLVWSAHETRCGAQHCRSREPARHARAEAHLHAWVALHAEALLPRLVLAPPPPVRVQPLERSWQIEAARLERAQRVVLLDRLHRAVDGTCRVLRGGVFRGGGGGGGGTELLPRLAQCRIELREINLRPLPVLSDELGWCGALGQRDRKGSLPRSLDSPFPRDQPRDQRPEQQQEQGGDEQEQQPHRQGLGIEG
eukprot:scaffold39753_cov65-Phaeocystis_antarctica.AAC.9